MKEKSKKIVGLIITIIARRHDEAIFPHVMLSVVEASVHWYSYRSFDAAQDDKVERLLRSSQ